MRTTINLPDPLLERAKGEAARENLTLSELVESALRDRILRRPADAKSTPFRLVTFGDGGLQPGRSWDRLKDVIDEEDAERALPDAPSGR